MMNTPLTVHMILERAYRFFGKKEIVTRQIGGLHRYTYNDFYHRTLRLAAVLRSLGIKPGDRVATFAWNSYRHMELYFAIPCLGAVLHTVNIRLSPDQLIYIINHAEDQVLFFDLSLLPIIKQIRTKLKTVRHFVVLHDCSIEDEESLVYERLLNEAPTDFTFPKVKEDMAAGLCYTSGTTGNPKGVLYSHRSIYLHSMAVAMVDTLAICERDVIMPVVPMFHANAWGLPFAATMIGATQVLPASFLQPHDLLLLIQQERVTVTAGVPTIWIGIMGLLEKEQFDLSSLRMMVVGGSAVPASMIEFFDSNYNIPIVHAWGMTETSPLGAVSRVKSYLNLLSSDEQLAIRIKQGIPVAGVEVRVVDEAGNPLPWDGKSRGELQVRGPWVARAYFNTDERAEAFQNGWFSTGDVVTIDTEGYIAIADRTKDLIKSGGEWISSVDLENALLSYPKIQEAAVIAVRHEKWVERPLACVVSKPEFRNQLSSAEVIEYLRGKFASWCLPDEIVFINEIPKTSVGKFDKKRLREQYRDFQWSQ
ncbi:MAG: long-chain fatty acid--CoA ligase [Acidobacteriota bacterium]